MNTNYEYIQIMKCVGHRGKELLNTDVIHE